MAEVERSETFGGGGSDDKPVTVVEVTITSAADNIEVAAKGDHGEDEHVYSPPLPNEMLLQLFGYMDEQSLFQCRLVTPSWQKAADELLPDKALSLFSQTHDADIDDCNALVSNLNVITCLMRSVRGVRFTSLRDLEDFLDIQELGNKDNPFPNRTIIIHFQDLGLKQSIIPDKKRRLTHSLERLATTFGDQVWTAYVVFDGQSKFDWEIFSFIFKLRNLKSLSLHRRFWRLFLLPSALLPFLKDLTTLQIFGTNGLTLYQNLFLPRYKNQILNFRVGPDFMRMSPANLAPVCSHASQIPPPPPLSTLLPKVQKLVLKDPCAGLILTLGAAGSEPTIPSKLEEFGIFLSRKHRCSSISRIKHTLTWLDRDHSTSLRKLFFHIGPMQFNNVTREMFCNTMATGAGLIQYPNVIELTISHSCVKRWPMLLVFLAEKCPNLKRIVFRGLLNFFKDRQAQPDEAGTEAGFKLYCRRWFNLLPESVKWISVPTMGLMAERTRVRKERKMGQISRRLVPAGDDFGVEFEN